MLLVYRQMFMLKKHMIGFAMTAALMAGLAVPAEAGEYDDLFRERYDRPQDVGVLGQFVSQAVLVGQYDQAISTLEQHLVKYPRDARAKFNLAKVYANVGSWELTKRNLQDALEIGDLTPEETATAEKLLARTNGALAGFEWTLDATVGVKSTWLDTDEPYPFGSGGNGWRDRQDWNPYVAASGSLRMDLDTPLNDALIWSGGFLAERRYEDINQGNFNPFSGPNFGGTYLHNRGQMALTLDKGIETTAVDSIRVQTGVFAEWRTYNPSVTDVALGTSVRLIVQPSVDTAVYVEGKYANLEQGRNISADHRFQAEVGTSWRLTYEHSIGIAGKYVTDITNGGTQISENREIEFRYSGLLPARPFGSVWTHQIGVAGGDFRGRDASLLAFFVPDPSKGHYWKADWTHTFQFDGQNSISVGYEFKRVDFDSDSGFFFFDNDYLTHSVGVSYTKSF